MHLLLICISVVSCSRSFEVVDSPLRIAFGSCFDVSFPYQDIFKQINDDQPNFFIWHGDFAYISRTKRVNYLQYFYQPRMLSTDWPSLLLDMVLKAKHKVKKLLDRIYTTSFSRSKSH